MKLPHAQLTFEKAIVQSPLFAGIMWSPYAPAARGLALTVTGEENAIVVFSLAPARQTWSYGTRSAQIVRLLMAGR